MSDAGGDSSRFEFSLVQVEYTTPPSGAKVILFGRKADTSPVTVVVGDFPHYFYVGAATVTPGETIENDQYRSVRAGTEEPVTSLTGHPVRRVYVSPPGYARDLARNRFSETYEADLSYTTRFLLDTGVKGGASALQGTCSFRDILPAEVDVPLRVCMLDIECDDSRGFPDAGVDPLVSLTAWDSYTDTYTVFFIRHPQGGENDPSVSLPGKSVVIRIFPSEGEMLGAFVAYIRESDPDVIAGWNVQKFDLPYISRRLSAHYISPDALGRIRGFLSPERVRGRVVFDLLAGYKKLKAKALPSYRLDAVAKVELGEEKVHFAGGIHTLWRDNPSLLIEYNVQDVALCVGIDGKEKILDFSREIARYVGCPIEKTIASSAIVDTHLLRIAHGRWVLPSRPEGLEKTEFVGATVLTPSSGIRENVAVFDLKSLYPMAMMTLNASLETKDPLGEYTSPSGARFRSSPDGITREMIAGLLTQRDERKRLRNAYPHGSREYEVLDQQQNVIKVIMNTYYGVSGNPSFRLYDPDIAAAVTSTGRAIIEFTKRELEGMGHEVVYGDSVGKGAMVPIWDMSPAQRYDAEGIPQTPTFLGEFPIESLFSSVTSQRNGKDICDIREQCYGTAVVLYEGTLAIAPLREVVRHTCGKRMFRITPPCSERSVDVTEDHGVMVFTMRTMPWGMKEGDVWVDEVWWDRTPVSPLALTRGSTLAVISTLEGAAPPPFSPQFEMYTLPQAKVLFPSSPLVEEIPYEGYVYDIAVGDNFHHFFANGICVHNTDSTMVSLPRAEDVDGVVATAKAIEVTLNASYDRFAREVLHAGKHYFSTKFEKLYARFFQAGRKKRYAGHLVWKEGLSADKIDITGFETQRSDTPAVTKDLLEGIIEMILRGEGEDVIKGYIRHTIREYRKGSFTLEEIGIPSGISKHFTEYKSNDIRVRAAKYSNNHLGTNFTAGSKPKRIYVKSPRSSAYPPTDVIAFEFPEQIPEGFVVDYDTMLAKTVQEPVTRIVESLGWQWSDLDPKMTTLSTFGIS